MTQLTERIDMPALGPEGDRCSACRAPLAIDQRYCLQCGQRRGARRVDFAELLPLDETSGSAHGAGSAAAAPPAAGQVAPVQSAGGSGPWTPLAVVASVATLGLMLLVGVMIGKDDDPTTVAAAPAAAPAVASTDAGGAAAAGGSDAAGGGGAGGGGDTKTASDKGGDKGGGGDKTVPASQAPGAQELDEGDLEALENATGDDAADASNDLPDTVATPGEPPPTDNEEPGAGTDAHVIK